MNIKKCSRIKVDWLKCGHCKSKYTCWKWRDSEIWGWKDIKKHLQYRKMK